MDNAKTFRGFVLPSQNWSKLPHELINQLPAIDSLGELECILYVLRHTWGFREFGKLKKITIDEFMYGRKRKDGSRMDNGTGLSNPTVISGLARAVEHGFLVVEKDDRDEGRKKRYYMLNMFEEFIDVDDDLEDLLPYKEVLHEPKEVLHEPKEVSHRTEKETLDKETSGKKHPIERERKSTSKRRDGLVPDSDATMQGFDMLANQAQARGKAWKGRYFFEEDDRIAFLADEAVKLYGVPMQAELPILLARLKNLAANNVIPQDLRDADQQARKKWTVKPTGITDGLIRLARTRAIERIGAIYETTQTGSPEDNTADALAARINRG